MYTPETLRACINNSEHTGTEWAYGEHVIVNVSILCTHAGAWEEDKALASGLVLSLKSLTEEHATLRKRLEALEAENLGLLDAAVKAAERLGAAEKFIERAFVAYPNLDLDVERVAATAKEGT